MTQQDYERHLDELLDEVFKEMVVQKLSLRGLAERSGVSVSALSMINSRITRLPRHKTVVLLAEGVGMKVALVPPPKTPQPKEKARGK